MPDDITVGCHSFIFIRSYKRYTFPVYCAEEILQTLSEFELQHPELEVYHWHVESHVDDDSEGRSPDVKVDGLWIDHRPKQKKRRRI